MKIFKQPIVWAFLALAVISQGNLHAALSTQQYAAAQQEELAAAEAARVAAAKKGAARLAAEESLYAPSSERARGRSELESDPFPPASRGPRYEVKESDAVAATTGVAQLSQAILQYLPEFACDMMHGGLLSKEQIVVWRKNILSLIKELDVFTKFTQKASEMLSDASWVDKKRPKGVFFNPEVSIKDGYGSALREYSFPFIQKKVIPADAQICFFGDSHGSVHSMIRNLYRLVTLGYLTPDFKVVDTENTFLVFLGDYSDRGLYGLESLALVTALKLENWDNVVISRGNHEDTLQNSKEQGLYAEKTGAYGAKPYGSVTVGELSHKLGRSAEKAALKRDIQKMCTLLPLMTLVQLGVDGEFLQCCHGGVDTKVNLEKLRVFPRDLGESVIQLLPGYGADGHSYGGQGFQWSDVTLNNGGKHIFNAERSGGYISDVAALEAYMEVNNIALLLRGHQDLFYGCKMFFQNRVVPADLDARIAKFEEDFNLSSLVPVSWPRLFKKFGWGSLDSFYKVTEMSGYPREEGPFPWRVVVDGESQNDPTGFLMKKYQSITFSSAAQGRSSTVEMPQEYVKYGFPQESLAPKGMFPFDCFGILIGNKDTSKLRMKVVETRLEKDAERNGKYVVLDLADKATELEPHNLLHVTW